MQCIGDFSMKNKSLLEERPKISASSVVRALLVLGLSSVAPAGSDGEGDVLACLAEAGQRKRPHPRDRRWGGYR